MSDVANERRDRFFQSDCGRVRAIPPTKQRQYWRLEFEQHGRRRQPSGGKTRATAEAKMALILRRLDADLDGDREQVLGDAILDAWMQPGQLQKGGKPWTDGTRKGHEHYVRNYLRPVLGGLRAEEWGRRQYRTIVQSAPTPAEAAQIRRRLSALLGWALRAGHLHPGQVLALQQVSFVREAHHLERPRRVEAANSGQLLPQAVAMSAGELAEIARAAQAHYEYGELLVEFAAATGLRQGELLALTADDVDLRSRFLRVERQWNAKAGKLSLPKGNKTRTAIYRAGATITGYDLPASLAVRCAQARAEQAAGRNPLALIFPSPRGSYWSSSNLDSRVWIAAMAEAGVPSIEWYEPVRTGNRKGQMTFRRGYIYTMHSLRDRFAISALNEWKFDLNELQIVGGWANSKVIFERYYGVARDALDRLQAKTELREEQ